MAKKKPPQRFTLTSLVRDSIEARGMTAYAVSQLSGVNVSIVGRFLTGKSGLTFASADKIVDGLGIRYAEVGTLKAKGKRS